MAAVDDLVKKFLTTGEIVHLALDGNGWTWVDPLILATDRRVLHLRRGVLGLWSKRAEIPAREVSGASVETGFLFGTVTIASARGQRLRMRYDSESSARDFVDSINRLLTGRRR